MKRTLPIVAISILFTACAAQPETSPPGLPHREVVVPNPSPPGWLSPAVRSGNLVFLSGQLGRKPGSPTVVPGGAQAETEQAFQNIREVLGKIGLGLDDVVKCTVFLADLEDYPAMNEVYMRHFPKDPPARSAMAVDRLARDARVEIECIAGIPAS